MFSKSKVSQSMIDAVNSVLGEKSEEKIVKNVLLDEASEKVPTPTGMKVYGSNYGNSMKARKDQTSHEIDKVKEPKDKELAKEELKGNQHKIDANKNNKIDAQDFKILKAKKKANEEMTFAEKLINSLQEKKDVVMPEDAPATSTPKKNQDVADKSYLKDKPGVKSDLKNLGRFLTGKKETNEEVELNEDNLSDIAKKHGMQLNRTTYGAGMKHPTHGEVSINRYGEWNHKGKTGDSTDKFASLDKHLSSLKEELELDEQINEVLSKDATAGDWISDFVHSDNPKFAGKSKAERKKMALGAYYGQQNETANDDKPITTDTLAGRMPGGKINSFKSYKLKVSPLDKEGDKTPSIPPIKQPVQTPAMKSHEVHEESSLDEATPSNNIPFDGPYTKTPSNIKDKSGAVHTPMSRAKDLARQSFKKLKNEMLGKAPGNN